MDGLRNTQNSPVCGATDINPRLCSSITMRVIAGTYRSRRLTAPGGRSTRPTSDRLRETLFNVLSPHIEGARFADLYAGTGAVGIEAISRGAAHVTFVENAEPALAALRSNLGALGILSGYTLEARNVVLSLRQGEKRAPGFSLVYLDPPWEDAQAYAQSFKLLGQPATPLLAPGALVIAEHARRMPALDPEYGALSCYRLLEQGDAALSFFQLRGS